MKPIQIAPSSNTTSDGRLFGGFPWVSAIICYSLSWSFLLVRPNTLYWDDWRDIYALPKRNLANLKIDMGLPPWNTYFESYLFQDFAWIIRVFTFISFFVVILLIFELAKQTFNFGYLELKYLILLTAVVPVNHARASLVVTDYTTSYLVFFIAWLLIVKTQSNLAFVSAWLIFFWAMKLNSLMFFLILPITNYLFVSIMKDTRSLEKSILKATCLAAIVPTYLLSRRLFWSPLTQYQPYNSPAFISGLRGLILFAPAIVATILIFLINKSIKNRDLQLKSILFIGIGLWSTALALFPYIISDNLDRYMFSFDIGWQSRHLMLTPLGISFVIMGLSQIVSKSKHSLAKLSIVFFISLNFFVGSQYYLQATQQEEVVELLKTNRIKESISEFVDETPQFKGRGARYEEYEFFGMLKMAGYEYPRTVGYKYVCKAAPEGVRLTLKSDVTFLQGLRTRQLGSYFEITPCSKVLATEN